MKKILCFLSALLFLHAGAQYNSLLWKISGNGLKNPSYLYGTMHTSDARVFAFGDSVLPYFASAKAYAMELDPKEAFNLGLIPKLMMGKGYSLKNMLPQIEYALLDSLIKKQIGYPVSLFDNVAPVFTMMILEAAQMELKDSSIAGNKDVLDMYFYKLAKHPSNIPGSARSKAEKRKKIIGIETVGEQIEALNALSYMEQAELLLSEIRGLEENAGAGTELVKFYVEQNLDSLFAYGTDAEMPEKYFDALITQRNLRMADRIDKFIREQSTFIAVGALHLPKEIGLIDLLRKKGYSVEPVKN